MNYLGKKLSKPCFGGMRKFSSLKGSCSYFVIITFVGYEW